MQTKVMVGQEKMANGSERDVISLITLQNGKRLDFSGLVVVVAVFVVGSSSGGVPIPIVECLLHLTKTACLVHVSFPP